jgi:hypothetical protein
MPTEKNYTLKARCGYCGNIFIPEHAGDDTHKDCGGQALYVEIIPKEKEENDDRPSDR